MKILMLTANDPAGMGIAFTRALNRYTGHSCRLVTSAERYGFAYETDIHLPECANFDELEQLLAEADVFHFHILTDENTRLGPLLVKDFIRGKKLVHHHHGHPHFRANPAHYRKKYQRLGRRVLVSTPDLLKLLPEATWLPNLVELDGPLLRPQPEPAPEPVLVGQSPTRKELKNTAELVEVMARLRDRADLPPFDLRIIEGMPHRQCLAAKGRCHLIFDHLQGYYGVSSLESLAQGKPVIAGLDEWNRSCIQEFTGAATLPWLVVRDAAELEKTLARLIRDPEARADTGQKSRQFMERYWHPARIAAMLAGIYEEL